MKKYGWVVHFVTPDKSYPFNINIHTHGFPEKFGHQDIQICAPLSQNIAQGIMHNFAQWLEEGKAFKSGKKYRNIIEGFPVLMLPAMEEGREVLRVIFPDKDGSFETEFSKKQMKDITN
jgi:hypothetical protein